MTFKRKNKLCFIPKIVYPHSQTFDLCLIAKDQKEFLRAKRLISKVRINSWSYCGVARAEFARA